ncbi:hypothetical protein QC999_gp18 [Microbacterium phage Cressida]|uniref:Uncharacterized protein n=2 Tax=Mementomorivirus TaxID=2733194 RepID=A0A514DI86_9CAUD|nr:hypothetical protein HOT41_gp18 [Microbacterium phage MementoMori]YP_010750905.1 hypothetical protein QC999_gp18 [Microbacterium phage Cressida]AWY05345.1 hypothetical protein SEA_MEMENTOMORI_91 [Microbacterium phage MementoMori]QDH93332.1 hypothetical protein PBI_CRESSIDA_90 [Microbacterium phage Cressida]
MTLWCAKNGWVGMADVGVLVEADTEEEARTAASEALRASDSGHREGYDRIRSIRAVTLPFVGDELP